MNAQETNWLQIAKEITEPLKCCHCSRPIGDRGSFPRYILIDGEMVNDGEICVACAQQYAD